MTVNSQRKDKSITNGAKPMAAKDIGEPQNFVMLNGDNIKER
jgi:hypothetical protein